MTTYEMIIKLCQNKGIAPTALEKELGFGRGSIGKLKKGETSAGRLQKIADFFNIPVQDLLTENQNLKSNNALTSKDEKDISKDLSSIMNKLTTGENGPATFNGNALSPESAELFKDQLEIMLRNLKIINKEKYNPAKDKG